MTKDISCFRGSQGPVPTNAVLRFQDLVAAGLVDNRTTLKRWIREGRFPAPLVLAPNTLAWRAEEIAQWLSARERRTYEPGSSKEDWDDED